LSSELTAGILNLPELAMLSYSDVGVKNPERLLNIPDEDDAVQKQIQQIQQKAQEVIGQMQAEVQKIGQDLVSKELEIKTSQDKLELRNERALGTENHLRETIQNLKSQMKQQADFLQNIGQIKDEKDKLEDVRDDIEKENIKGQTEQTEPTSPVEKHESPVVVNIQKSGGFKINRDKNGDMTDVEEKDSQGSSHPASVPPQIIQQVVKPHGFKIERDKNGDMTAVKPLN